MGRDEDEEGVETGEEVALGSEVAFAAFEEGVAGET